MRLLVETDLACDAPTAWSLVRTAALLRHVAAPLLRFESVSGALPEVLAAGLCVDLRLYLFGFVPIGSHQIQIVGVDEEKRTIQTREYSPILRQWDHTITITSLPSGCCYSDAIEMDAGVFTVLVYALARQFFLHRQRRWRALAHRVATGQPPY